jgi:hypothetical protein
MDFNTASKAKAWARAAAEKAAAKNLATEMKLDITDINAHMRRGKQNS